MFLDYVKIFIKAGNGGDGAVSFHREKFVPNGGPDGGDGGNGGDVIFVATKNVNTLAKFKFQKHFFAKDGEKGGAKNCTGKSAPNLEIFVPVGTVVRDAGTGKVICDLVEDGERVTVLKGGKGGKGNNHFKTSKRQAPTFAQLGEKTQKYQVILELKTIADVGLVGYPNVGKSTLLSVLTEAKPKIANYHFTTLTPNLGVVKMFDEDFVIADIPGLIEGASEGAGLGHYFLRHIERVRLIVHIVDISGSEGRDPYEDYLKINDELKKYSERLASLPQIVCASKSDLLEDGAAIEKLESKIGQKVYPISSITRNGLDALLKTMYEQLKVLFKVGRLHTDTVSLEKEEDMSFYIEKVKDRLYSVRGGLVEYCIRNVTLSSYESFAHFQKLLKDKGVIDELKRQGMKEGDTVEIGDIEFEWVE
ncbi:MAG: GTPase ObgE [Clostridiales bacterium]|nr:GTPase ObgE [Clostridiales bacterium]